jgi:hypothetical protein
LVQDITTGNINFMGNLYQNGSPYSGSTQWTSLSGGSVFFTGGNVGINTTTLSSSLSIRGGLNTDTMGVGLSTYLAGSFTAANNVTTASNITGLSFNSNSVYNFNVKVSAYVTTTSGNTLNEFFTLEGAYMSSGWGLYEDSIGDTTGIEFYITSSGQIQYTSTNTPGWSSTVMRYAIMQL